MTLRLDVNNIGLLASLMVVIHKTEIHKQCDLFYKLILKLIMQMGIQECPKSYIYQYFMIQWRQRYIEYRLPVYSNDAMKTNEFP